MPSVFFKKKKKIFPLVGFSFSQTCGFKVLSSQDSSSKVLDAQMINV